MPYVPCPCPARPAARARARMLFLLMVLCATAPAARAQQTAGAGGQGQRPIRALYITGGGFHDFVTQARIVPPGIAERTNIEWTIDHSADTATAALIARHRNTAWADQFDVVVYNMSFSWVVDPQWIERIAHAHRDKGVGAVILHGATHSYRRSTTDAWRELMGAASMRHDSQRQVRLERMAVAHPILKDLPKGWSPGIDELYDLDKVWPTMTPLAQAWSVETEEHHTLAWTNTLGSAKVFVTTMGHNSETMADPAYLDLVTRGLLWTVGKLQPDGTPAPGFGARTPTR